MRPSLSGVVMTKGWFGAAALVLIVGVGRCDDTPPHQLAARALGVLRQHCASCHGNSSSARGQVVVVDRVRLVAAGRNLVDPGSPETSLLLTRVEAGSMPPGRHPKLSSQEIETLRTWIAAGAPAFQGDDYVLSHILDDINQLTERDRRYVRYLSLDHLLYRPDAARELSRRKAALEGVLHHFAGSTAELLHAVDEGGLIFRIDLRPFNWHLRPLEIVGAPETDRVSLLTRFDLLLLEYPYAVLPTDARLFEELGRKFFEPSRPVRPIAYLRADWFAARVLEPPLANELRRKPSTIAAPEDVAQPVDQVPSGTRILPLDSVMLELDRTPLLNLVVTTDRPDKTLTTGAVVAVNVENPRGKDVWVEVVHTNSQGQKTVLGAPTLLRMGEKKRFAAGERFPVAANAGSRERVTFFVYPEKFERGQVLRGEGLADRFVHPFYALNDEGLLRDSDLDLSAMQVATIGIEVVR